MKIVLASDHAGYDMKEKIKKVLSREEHDITDAGTASGAPADYPDYAHPAAEMVAAGHVEYGILFCGSGNGVAMSANRHRKVRAALCWNKETALLARKHNNANVLCIPARFVDIAAATEIVTVFLITGFESGRHAIRVNKIDYPVQ